MVTGSWDGVLLPRGSPGRVSLCRISTAFSLLEFKLCQCDVPGAIRVDHVNAVHEARPECSVSISINRIDDIAASPYHLLLALDLVHSS